MPGRRDVRTLDSTLCRRCQHAEPAITVRTEPLCKACFCKYVSTKIVKRMETFRVRHAEEGQERTLLLPLSLGCASVALLHVLSQHLQGQRERTGRTGFQLHVLHLRDDDGGKYIGDEIYERVKSRFSTHAYSALLLSDVLPLQHISSLPAQNSESDEKESATNASKLALLLDSTHSATSRADLKQILKRKLIVSFAKTHKCEAVLWGDSTTRLAERILAETAKGRGFSLPWLVADGESPLEVPLYYPMRDLLSKEIAAFVSLVDPPLDDLVVSNDVKRSVNLKNTTIDDLMTQYFESVERDFPSIVANVVKTTGKLQATPLAQAEQECELCEMPLDGRAPERSRLCYGCIRTLPQAVG